MPYYIRRQAYPNELYHHGILGQKWGVRNGPPYPLGSGDHSSSEEKAGWKKSLSGDGNESKKKKISAVKSVYKTQKRSNKTSETDHKSVEKDWASKENLKKSRRNSWNYNRNGSMFSSCWISVSI